MDRLNQIRKKIGFLFQYSALYDSLTVEENVAFSLERHTKMPAAERKERVRKLVAGVGMEKDLEKMPGEISGGMQKRVGLARALALEPDILLLDEPTAGLDPITAGEIGELISQLQKDGKPASIVVTHDIHGARAGTNPNLPAISVLNPEVCNIDSDESSERRAYVAVNCIM